MAFESTKAAVKQRKLVANTKAEFAKELEIDFKIDKLLSSNSVSRILSKEIQDGSVIITGKTKIDIVALENNQIKTSVQEIEWNKKVDVAVIGEVSILINETNVAFDLIEKPVAKVELLLDIYAEGLDIIPSIKVDNEDIVVKKQDTNIVNIVGSAFNSFTITHEIEQNAGVEVVSKKANIFLSNVILTLPGAYTKGSRM